MREDIDERDIVPAGPSRRTRGRPGRPGRSSSPQPADRASARRGHCGRNTHRDRPLLPRSGRLPRSGCGRWWRTTLAEPASAGLVARRSCDDLPGLSPVAGGLLHLPQTLGQEGEVGGRRAQGEQAAARRRRARPRRAAGPRAAAAGPGWPRAGPLRRHAGKTAPRRAGHAASAGLAPARPRRRSGRPVPAGPAAAPTERMGCGRCRGRPLAAGAGPVDAEQPRYLLVVMAVNRSPTAACSRASGHGRCREDADRLRPGPVARTTTPARRTTGPG